VKTITIRCPQQVRESLKEVRGAKDACDAELAAARARIADLEKEATALHMSLWTREQELGLIPVGSIGDAKVRRELRREQTEGRMEVWGLSRAGDYGCAGLWFRVEG
jgi:hypothetical protein